MKTYLMTARSVAGGAFGAEPGPVRYLEVAAGATGYTPKAEISRTTWFKRVRAAASARPNPNSASWSVNAAAGEQPGDVLVYVHGYNNDLTSVLARQTQIAALLEAEHWRGVVVGFDWPSDDSILNYLEDRSDASAVARYLVTDALTHLCANQQQGCETNVHLLGHSTGAYVVMKAFETAPDLGELYAGQWRIGQVAFIAADVASAALSVSDNSNAAMFARIMRLTNYSNGDDRVLAVSNAKRLGVRPRAGRVGLPTEARPKAINVDVTDLHRREAAGRSFKSLAEQIVFSHGFHFESRLFARDLAMTLEGAIDRHKIPTREIGPAGLVLVEGERPAFQLAVLDLD